MRPSTAPLGATVDPVDSGWDTGSQQAVVVAARPSGTSSTLVRASGATAVVPAAELNETNPVGQMIDGRYRIISLIGEGGMGRVYEAEHVDIGKRVALKILHQVYSRTVEVVARFRREARAASRIGHPNIVDVTDSGTTHDGSVYFVMEYLEGVELGAVIDREGALDIQRALHVSAQICRALSAAHNAGIVHRDLKPENIYLVVREGTADFVKVLDFGIAKSAELEGQRTERLTHPGIAMGTPEYMAPEQAAGQAADARSDVYAVGAILYEMLTGEPPYDGDNFMQILTKKATQEPAPPITLRPEIPQAVNDLTLKALARAPEDRPQSMEALDYELTKCLAGRGAAVAKVLGMVLDPSSGQALGSGALSASSASHAIAAHPVDTAWQEPILETELVTPSLKPKGRGAVLATLIVLFLCAAGGYYYLTRYAPGADELPGTVSAAPVADGSAAEGAIVTPDNHRAGSSIAPRNVRGSDRGAKADGSRGHKDKEPSDTKPAKKRDTSPPDNMREARGLLADAETKAAKMRYAEAKELYQRVAKGRYLRGRAELGLADVAFQTGDNDVAIRNAKAALRDGVGSDARFVLGNALFKNKQFDQAKQQYELLLKAEPGHKGARRALNETQRKLGGK